MFELVNINRLFEIIADFFNIIYIVPFSQLIK